MWKLINGQMVFAPDEPPAGGSTEVDDETEQEDDPPAPSDEGKDKQEDESDLLRSIKADPSRAEKEIKDLRQEAADNRKKLQDIENANEAARKKELADSQQFETLYTETNSKLEAATARIEELEGELEAYHQSDAERLEALSSALPDHLRELIAKMTPREAVMWIEAHESELRKPVAPGTDAGVSGDKRNKRIEPAYDPMVRL